MIEIVNLKPGDSIAHSIAYVFGYCYDITQNIQVYDSFNQLSSWQVKNCFFKAFVNLKNGKNEIEFKTDNCSLHFVLYYNQGSLSSNTRSVRVLYVVCDDDDDNGEFQSPALVNNDCKSALKRISLAAKLLQTFISEILYKRFLIRKTVKFYNEIKPSSSSSDLCELYRTKLKKSQALEMKPNELFIHLANEILSNNELYDANCKYIAVLSFTRYEPNSSSSNDMFSNTKGFCALGAEWLMVYGSPCLYTWAEELCDVQKCFTDETLIDETRFMNDTAFRNTYWACYSTTLGSLLHEFSHVLDLGHNKTGIMARGFDNFHSFFTINFNECKCYNKHKNMLSNNKAIDCVITKERDVQDGVKLYKQEITKAVFKNDIERNLIILSNLVWDKAKIDIITHQRISFCKENTQNCICFMNCTYEECNLNILFNHKWLNDTEIFMKQQQQQQSSDRNLLFDIQHLNSQICIKTVNKLIVYELRDKCANTLDYKYFDDQVSNEYLVDIDKEKFFNNNNNDSKIFYEIFLLDCNGNIHKFKYK